jgi:methyl-accepting chemotaxis protein
MDRITQQNASVVEESTDASFALASESQQLTQLIGRFQIGRTAPDGLGAAAPTQLAAERRRRSGPPSHGAAARKLEPVESSDWQEF